MSVNNTEREYGVVSKSWHWLTVVIVIVLFVLASRSEDLPRGPEKLELVLLHASFGLLLLFVLAARLLWRWCNATPARLPHIPTWQHVISRAVHYGLYIVLIAQALVGMARFATAGFEVPFFGLFKVAFPMGKDEAMNELMGTMHEILPCILLALLALHVLAALYHHFRLQDDTLRRMTCGMKPAD